MMNNKDVHIKDELQEKSPFLEGFLAERKGGAKVPSGYFENLSSRIADKVQEEEKVRPKVVNIQRERRPRRWRMMAAAASVLLLVGAWVWFSNPLQTSNESSSLAQLSGEEVLEYLDENIDKFQLQDLANSGIITSEDINYYSVGELSEEEEDLFLVLTISELEGNN